MLVAAGCSAGTRTTRGGALSSAAASSAVRIAITPAGASDAAPNRGLEVRALGGRITSVVVRTAGDPVSGTLDDAGTVWHSRWALDVSQRYTVIATAADPSGARVTETRSFRTLAPRRSFSAEIIEGDGQSYGVGMPIIVYLSQPVADRAAVERALQVSSSRPVVGAWFWDEQCRTAPVCLYFRPRHYWPAHTVVHFTGHLNGVEASPGVYGTHTLTQTFRIGQPLMVVANTADHYMKVIRNGKLFAHWPISTGRPGDETPDGSYLTIEKANPVDMVGPGYNIEVPWSVRFTWSGDYLHDAFWSVGEQGFTNVSHGCVNMSPADAEIFYKMADPGDPVKVLGSPKAGTWDNGWTMWFLTWKQWVGGSALHEAVLAGPHGSTPVSPSASARPPAPGRPARPRTQHEMPHGSVSL
ncbi:MAG TPA: Ig-like domain-containing protein [Solirubrobacteraceae bacterium]|nr:Ig-like domain-containing protein [Solirubrobacteraceae bacterium]